MYADAAEIEAGNKIASLSGHGGTNWQETSLDLISDFIFIEFEENSGAAEICFYTDSDGSDGNGGAGSDSRSLRKSDDFDKILAVQNNLIRVKGKSSAAESPYSGKVIFDLDVDPVVYKRCFLVYSGKLRTPADCSFRINGSTEIEGYKGFGSKLKLSASKFYEEIPVSVLKCGQNSVDFLTLDANASIQSSDMCLVFEGDSGWNSIRSVYANGDYVSDSAKFKTKICDSEVTAEFECKGFADQISILKFGTAQGKIKLEYRDGVTWKDSGYDIDLSSLDNGWNKLQGVPVLHTDSLRLSALSGCEEVEIRGIKGRFKTSANPLETLKFL